MANETSKQMLRRSTDHRFMTRWIVGDGIDIGCGPDPLTRLGFYFPLMRSVREWDLPDGDACFMAGVAGNQFDFVHSSHCLEHLTDPATALQNWIRICKPGGHLIITVPEEDLYEQGVWPSTFNADHKWTFTILKPDSWSPRSINLHTLLEGFKQDVEIIRLEKLDAGFDYALPRQDQTLNGIAECAIEMVLRKRLPHPSNDQIEQQRFAITVRQSEARESFRKAVALHSAGQADQARELYHRVLEVNQDDVACLNNLAMLSPPAEAEQLLKHALKFAPDYPDAHINLAWLLLQEHREQEAIPHFTASINTAQTTARAVIGLARCLEACDQFEELKQLLAERPAQFDLPEVQCCLARMLESRNRTDDAIAHLQHALANHPEHVEAHVYLGRQYFKQGRYPEGAENFEWIWRGRLPSSQIGYFTTPEGAPIRQDGKHILLSADSGLGDALQFIRYAEQINSLGAHVKVVCQPELVRLFSHQPFIEKCFPFGPHSEQVDIHLPLDNMIAAFRTTLDSIPKHIPYLAASPTQQQAWQARLARYEGLKVGLCWSGNPGLPQNARRSVGTQDISTLLELPGICFISLQKGRTAPLAPLLDWTDELTDMDCTAALVAELDLVVSVDSAVAHLAGALGKPVWLLNRFDSCWRWLDDRDDSPWYPTMRQFRQPAPNTWPEVVARLKTALEEFAASHRR